MAYGDKYTSYFYNFHGKLIRVKIKKKDYSGAVNSDMRITDLKIETNYQDEITPVVGTGAKVEFLADADNFTTYEDLLTSKEKEFYCEVYYNTAGDPGTEATFPTDTLSFTTDIEGPIRNYLLVVEVSDTERGLFSPRVTIFTSDETTETIINCGPLTFGNRFIVFHGTITGLYTAYTEVPSTPMNIWPTMTNSITKYDEILALPVHLNGYIPEETNLVFSGFSICDLNERQLLPFAHITMQFTDYIKRMEDKMDLPCLANLSANISVFNIIHDIITSIDMSRPLYVNSTLFEQDMVNDNDNTDTLVEQLFVETNVFYSDSVSHDSAYDAINKVLLPLGAHLYSYDNAWILERIEDITRDGDWSIFQNIYTNDETVSSTPTLKKAINKQDDDFEYIEESQVIEYASGVQKLILNLKETQLDSLSFNNYDLENIHKTADEWPTPQTLVPREWYIHEDAINVETGLVRGTMSTYLKWGYPYNSDPHAFENSGVYYAFNVQFNETVDNPTTLNIEYKMSSDDTLIDYVAVGVSMRCHIMVDGGAKSGYFLGPERENSSGERVPSITASNAYYWEQVIILSRTTTKVEKTWTFSLSINLTDNYPKKDSAIPLESVWQQLGGGVNVKSQGFILCIWPAKILLPSVSVIGVDPSLYAVARSNYLGDVATTVTQRDIPNKFTYYINESFLKTEEIDFSFMDLANINFANGFFIKDLEETALHPEWTAYKKTELWTSNGSIVPCPLVDIFAKMRFRNYYKTMHRLTAKILYNGYLKPFTVLTDDTIILNSSANVQFIITQYVWDVVNGTYDIVGQEYTDEDIVIGGVADSSAYPYDSSGEIPEPVFLPPAWYDVTEDPVGFFVTAQWNGVFSATGYRLRRLPYWQMDKNGVTGSWIQDFKEIYSGPAWSFVDRIESEGTPVEGMTVTYIVCAYNANQSSAYSEQRSITYTLIEGGLPE